MIGRTYLERGAPVVVKARWGPGGGPRNVLVQRGGQDGWRSVVRPFRGLRCSPGQVGPWRDPVASLLAVLDGTKPAAVATVPEGSLIEAMVVRGTGLPWFRGKLSLYVARGEAEMGALRAARAVEGDARHRALGLALGYSEADVRTYYAWVGRPDPALGRVPGGDDLKEGACSGESGSGRSTTSATLTIAS